MLGEGSRILMQFLSVSFSWCTWHVSPLSKIMWPLSHLMWKKTETLWCDKHVCFYVNKITKLCSQIIAFRVKWELPSGAWWVLWDVDFPFYGRMGNCFPEDSFGNWKGIDGVGPGLPSAGSSDLQHFGCRWSHVRPLALHERQKLTHHKADCHHVKKPQEGLVSWIPQNWNFWRHVFILAKIGASKVRD